MNMNNINAYLMVIDDIVLITLYQPTLLSSDYCRNSRKMPCNLDIEILSMKGGGGRVSKKNGTRKPGKKIKSYPIN